MAPLSLSLSLSLSLIFIAEKRHHFVQKGGAGLQRRRLSVFRAQIPSADELQSSIFGDLLSR